MRLQIALFAMLLVLIAACKPVEPPMPEPPRVVEGITINGQKAAVELMQIAPGQEAEYRATATRGNETIVFSVLWKGIAEDINGTTCVGYSKTQTGEGISEGSKKLACPTPDPYSDNVYEYSLSDGKWVLKEHQTVSNVTDALSITRRTTGNQSIDDVTVQAGTFAALKTVSSSPVHNVTDWYSPLVPIAGLVKSVEDRSKPKMHIEYELIRYASGKADE